MAGRRISLVVTLVATLAGCGLLDPEPARRTLIVQHHGAECMGMAPQLCLLMREPGGTEFLRSYGGIEGFAYEWGYTYEIEIEEHRVPNPPADGSSIRRVLRAIESQERVAAGTEFQIFLTAGSWGLSEIAAGRYRAYDAVELVCAGDIDCGGLSTQVAAGARIDFRLRHPATPDLPLEVVEWRACEATMIGSNTCSTAQQG